VAGSENEALEAGSDNEALDSAEGDESDGSQQQQDVNAKHLMLLEAGSDNEALDSAEGDESDGSQQQQDVNAKHLMLRRAVDGAAKRVEKVLVHEAHMDPAKHFKLAEQLARVLLQAQTVERDDWPKEMNDSELETMRGMHSDKISQHLDVPAEMFDLIANGRFWTHVLEAAFHGSPGMLPVRHTFQGTILNRYDPTGAVRGIHDDHAHCFTLTNGNEMLLLVGVSKWQWINAAKGTFGYCNRMFALAVRSAESDDDMFLEDYNGDPDDISDIELDYERDPDFADKIGTMHRVQPRAGECCYPPDALHPEVVWQVAGQVAGTPAWHHISGPARPGYWDRSPVPVMKMSPVQDGDRMEWKVLSVRPVREGVYSGKFALEIEDRELSEQLHQITDAGSKLYDLRDPTAMRRFLRAVTDRLEEVLHQAGIHVIHARWASSSDWISFDEVNEEGLFPVNVQFPGHDKDSGPRLKCELKSAKSVLIAKIAFEFLGDHGPTSPSPQTLHSCSSLHVRVLDQLLGLDGSQKVTAAISLSMISSRPVTVLPDARTEWLRKKKYQPVWMHKLCQDWGDLKLFGGILSFWQQPPCLIK
jgi:hypothetical protein